MHNRRQKHDGEEKRRRGGSGKALQRIFRRHRPDEQFGRNRHARVQRDDAPVLIILTDEEEAGAGTESEEEKVPDAPRAPQR